MTASLSLNRKTRAPACPWTCTRTSAPSLRSLQSTIQKRSSGNQFLHSRCSVEPGGRGRGRGRPCLGLRFAFNCPSSSSLACPPAAGDQKVIITIPVWKLHCPPSPRRQIKCSGSRLPTPGNYTPRPAGRPGGAVSQQAPGRSGGGLKFLPDWNLKCPEGSNSGPTTKDLPFLSFANRHHHGRFGALRRRQSDPNVAPLHSPVGGQLCCCSQGYRWSSSDQELPSAHKSTVSASYARAHSAASARCSPQTTVLTLRGILWATNLFSFI